MNNDVAVFVDLDNVAIGASEANIKFDVQLLLTHIQKETDGRIVLRKAYADWRQHRHLPKALAAAGFELHTTVNFMDKNLADMQMVVDAMETLVDGQHFSTYVLVTGDRDFMPLVQTLRKRGKQVIGIGIRHTSSGTLQSLVDKFIFYEDLVPKSAPTQRKAKPLAGKALLKTAVDELLRNESRVAASVVRQKMDKLSQGNFSKTAGGKMNFKKFLKQNGDIVQTYSEKTTLYILAPGTPLPKSPDEIPPTSRQNGRQSEQSRNVGQVKPTALHAQYRAMLKKQGLRVAPAAERLTILKDSVELLTAGKELQWRHLVQNIFDKHDGVSDQKISKSYINDTLHALREAGGLKMKNGDRFSPVAPMFLTIKGQRVFQESVMRTDAVYLRKIEESGLPFDLEEVSLALYDANSHVRYLQVLQQQYGSKVS